MSNFERQQKCSLFSETEITCPHPGDPMNGQTLDSGRFTVGDYVEYLCNGGHIMVGDPLAICTSNGTWSSAPPECKLMKLQNSAASNIFRSFKFFSCEFFLAKKILFWLFWKKRWKKRDKIEEIKLGSS